MAYGDDRISFSELQRWLAAIFLIVCLHALGYIWLVSMGAPASKPFVLTNAFLIAVVALNLNLMFGRSRPWRSSIRIASVVATLIILSPVAWVLLSPNGG